MYMLCAFYTVGT